MEREWHNMWGYIFQNFWLTYKGFFSITCYKISYRHCCYLPVPVNIKKRIVGISRWKELPSVLLKMAAYLLYARNMPRSGTLNCYNDIRDCFLPSAYLQVFNQVFNALLCPYHKLGWEKTESSAQSSYFSLVEQGLFHHWLVKKLILYTFISFILKIIFVSRYAPSVNSPFHSHISEKFSLYPCIHY